MKTWFPFTSYDFYAYLTTGMLGLAAFDRVFMGSMLASMNDWTVVAVVFWTAIAYLVGQLIAIPSSALFEHLVARHLLVPPATILLGLRTPRVRETILARTFGAREYCPLPVANSTSILRKIADKLDVQVGEVDGETAFQTAFPHARSAADTATRLDTFLNQYGMARNVSFASLIAAIMLIYDGYFNNDYLSLNLAIVAIVLALGLFGRFLKYYAAYAREVFRTFDRICE